uniref:Uncharacterized protein n=1 Tax=Lactuca sativa TaxID=4236 RepID=A0A9R1VXP3_LACSA|nr:hypothetical protein LSAT_V11C400227760 [Lactuca sativa]
MATKVQRIMTQLINLIFRFLQSGFDEYMDLVLEDAEEVNIKKKTIKALGQKQSFFTNSVGREYGIKHSIPGDFHKWVSIPTHNFSSFAYGFTPLKHKPLESLINVEREKLQTPEDLASIWDDRVSTRLRVVVLVDISRKPRKPDHSRLFTLAQSLKLIRKLWNGSKARRTNLDSKHWAGDREDALLA